jgi:hypothetical protein
MNSVLIDNDPDRPWKLVCRIKVYKYSCKQMDYKSDDDDD